MYPLSCTTGLLRGTLEEKLQAIAAAGFTHTEFLTRDLFESLRGPEYTRAVLRDSGLKIACYQLVRDFEGAPRNEIQDRLGVAEHLLDQAQWLGADVMIVCSNTAGDSTGEIDVLCEDMLRLAERAASRGVRIAYESLGWGRWMSDYRKGWDMIRRVNHPNLGLMLDASHIGSLGHPMSGILEIDPAKIFLAEVADLPVSRLEIAEQSRFYRLMPGEGMLPLGEFVRNLKRIGYSGVYSLEVFNDHYRQLDPLMVARRGHETLMRLLEDN